jgi:anti-sigma regulatory factor (Ser/Thr protein kinase)
MTGPGRPPLPSEAVILSDDSRVGEARRAVASLGRNLGLSDTAIGQASIVATEAAMNVMRHGGGGEFVLRGLEAGGIEILALDRGPGIADLSRALEDGYSSAGSSGTGLGAMRRLSSVFELWTAPGQGTIVMMRVGGPDAGTTTLGAVCVPHPHERECGDVWDFAPRPTGYRLVVADGLGHGPIAREAALRAVQGAERGSESPGAALEEAHRAALGTRGAAIAVADVDLEAGEVRYAGFGNIASTLVSPTESRSLVSMNGTIGQGTLRVREFTYPIASGASLVMCSDGLSTHWTVPAALAVRHPGLVAALLYRDHSRRRDDATVVVVRESTS